MCLEGVLIREVQPKWSQVLFDVFLEESKPQKPKEEEKEREREREGGGKAGVKPEKKKKKQGKIVYDRVCVVCVVPVSMDLGGVFLVECSVQGAGGKGC